MSPRIWFVFAALWTVGALVSVLLQQGPTVLKLLPVAGVGMLVLGILFICFAKSYYSDDKAKLVRTISEELCG